VIVTRKRKRRTHPARILVPLAVVALIAALLAWPPSQHLIANGPLRPLWLAGANVGSVVVRPLSFAGQQQTIADRNREIRDLNARLEQQRQAKSDADAQAARLQQQITALQNQPVPTPVPAPRRAPASGLAMSGNFGNAAGSPATGSSAPGSAAASTGAAAASEDEKRLAATWAAMEPEKAAAVAQRLPDAEVTRVLGAMDADSAGAIMNALPSGVAARISRSVAQVPAAQSR
jgi:flagellar motility protein MotE (MotC chaperone)